MSARSLTQLAVLVLGAVALGLGGVLVLRQRGGVTTRAADAGVCDLSAAPPALSPAREDVALLLWPEPGVTVALDGKAVVSVPDDPQSFPAGEHELKVDCAGKSHGLTVELLPFTPASVQARCDGFFVVGAACDDCLSTEAARKAAAKAGKSSVMFAAAAAQEKLELVERNRADHVLMQRWNVLTERYARVVVVVGREAPGPVASANQRLEELSQGFRSATIKKDPIAQDQAIRAGEATLRVFVHQARLARPDDCDFQRRLTAAL